MSASAVRFKEGDLLGIGAAARMLQVSEGWIRTLCDRGDLQYVRDTANRRLIIAESARDLVDKRRLAAGSSELKQTASR